MSRRNQAHPRYIDWLRVVTFVLFAIGVALIAWTFLVVFLTVFG